MASFNPFFSIVIPTKNRPELLRDSICSVIWQNFTDYELIISDNHNDASTLKVLKEFEHLPQIRIVRPPKEMKMIDHWEFATSFALGKYVILLADRKVLYYNALIKLKRIIDKFPQINIFSFGVHSYDEVNNKMGWCNAIGNTRKWKSDDLLFNFLNENLFSTKSFDIYFPKTLNGIYKNSFANEVRKKYGHYFNMPGVTTPDYSSFFINVFLNDEIVYIGEKIILAQGEHISNGRLFGLGKFKAYMDSLGYDDPYILVPIKAPLIYNLLWVDFLTIRSILNKITPLSSLNWFNYFKTNYYEIMVKKANGLDDITFNYFLNSWENGLINSISSHNLNINELKESAVHEFNNRNKPLKYDKIKRFSYHLRDFLSVHFSDKSFFNKIYPYYFKNIFHAAGFKNKFF